MADASVISRMNGKPRELNQGGTSTTETAFTSDGTTLVYVPLPSAAELADGTGSTAKSSVFTVRAWGRVVTSGTVNFTAAMYYGTSATLASDTKIEDSGATSLASLTTNWMIECRLVWDAVSNRINGWGRTQVHTTFDAEATIDNAVTSADPNGNTAQGFLISGTFGTGAAGNEAYLDGLEIIK